MAYFSECCGEDSGTEVVDELGICIKCGDWAKFEFDEEDYS